MVSRRRDLTRCVVWIACCLCVTSVEGTTTTAGQRETIERILAVVGGQVIMQSDVRAFKDLGLADVKGGDDSDAAVLAYLIERRLVLDEVDRFVVANPPPDRVERGLSRVAAQFSSPEELDDTLARVGFTADDLRQVLRDDARRDAYIENRFGAAVTGARETMVQEWIAGLVRRGQVIRIGSPTSLRGAPTDQHEQDLGGVEAGVADDR